MRIESVIALPPRPSAKGAIVGEGLEPRPSSDATGIGESIWAMSNWRNTSRSRIFAHETSRTSSRVRPSRRAKPNSAAAISTEASTSGINPARMVFGLSPAMRMGPGRLVRAVSNVLMRFIPTPRRLDQQARSRDHALGNFGHLLLLVHCKLAQLGEGLILRKAFSLHENALGAFDNLAFLECGFRIGQFTLQPAERVETADGHVEDRFHPLLLQSVHDISRDAGLDCRFNGGGIGAIDEHGDRAADRSRQLEQM